MTNKAQLTVLILLTTTLVQSCWSADDIMIADFEGADYGTWKAEGTAFGTAPAQGAFEGQMSVGGFKGKGLVNTYLGGDGSTGKLTSSPFTIQRKFINFLIGGGKNAEALALILRVEGKIARTATGPNERPGGSENLEWLTWDVSDLKGKTATLEIVDQATGGWGHFNVDNIIQSDFSKASTPKERKIVASEPLLLLPIENGGPKRNVTVSVGGEELRNFDIELADGEPDWWAKLDLTSWQGKEVTVRVNAVPGDSRALDQLRQSKTLPDEATAYKEPLRGQLRFSSRVGWLNDPNGMVYSQGQYHLFYQHNPYGWDWGNMHWGHAMSSDMVHWNEMPIALYPHSAGDMVYSGSAVVDKANTSGWKSGPNDLLVVAYTSTGRGECITYSNDKGRTWTEYEGNPVIKHKGEGRDPRVLWHEPTKHWVLVVWRHDEDQKTPGDKGGMDFYTSKDLKKWTFQSRSEGWFECPDFFELPIENEQKKWVLTGASSDYRIGTFDGKKFVAERPSLRATRGAIIMRPRPLATSPRADACKLVGFALELRECRSTRR
jgi:fructan beta-fructosidase